MWKKLLMIVALLAGGLVVYRKVRADRAEQDLWAQATDSVSATSSHAPASAQ